MSPLPKFFLSDMCLCVYVCVFACVREFMHARCTVVQTHNPHQDGSKQCLYSSESWTLYSRQLKKKKAQCTPHEQPTTHPGYHVE